MRIVHSRGSEHLIEVGLSFGVAQPSGLPGFAGLDPRALSALVRAISAALTADFRAARAAVRWLAVVALASAAVNLDSAEATAVQYALRAAWNPVKKAVPLNPAGGAGGIPAVVMAVTRVSIAVISAVVKAARAASRSVLLVAVLKAELNVLRALFSEAWYVSLSVVMP